MVEKWLLQVQEGMIQSLKDVMIRAVTGYTQVPRAQWVIDWPGQVVIAASSIYWTTDVSSAIVNGTLKVRICGYEYPFFLLFILLLLLLLLPAGIS